MADTKQLKITLVKSLICRNKSQRKIVEALGLKKLHQSIVVNDTPAIRGVIQKIGFMLNVEEL